MYKDYQKVSTRQPRTMYRYPVYMFYEKKYLKRK